MLRVLSKSTLLDRVAVAETADPKYPLCFSIFSTSLVVGSPGDVGSPEADTKTRIDGQ